jgi:mono/diheme cytochrome c family protein
MRTLFSTMMALVFVMGTAGAVRADGKDLYSRKCVGCHGKDGKAETPMGKRLSMKDLSSPAVQKAATDAQWEKTILEGYKAPDGKVLMYPSKVTPEEAKELVKVCRSFKK